MPPITLQFDDNQGWAANWAAFDSFVCDLLQTTFTRDSKSHRIEELERAIGGPLPPSAREWCTFILASDQLEQFTLRDCLVVERVKNHDAVSLLLQGEADYYWAIETRHLSDPDPPVVAYRLDYDSPDDCFVSAGLWSPTVSSFALDYFLSYLQSPGGGFGTRQSCDNYNREKLVEDFGQPTRFGHLELFLGDGVLAVIGTSPASWRHRTISVEIQQKTPLDRLPESVRRLLKDAHVIHGGLHEHR